MGAGESAARTSGDVRALDDSRMNVSRHQKRENGCDEVTCSVRVNFIGPNPGQSRVTQESCQSRLAIAIAIGKCVCAVRVYGETKNACELQIIGQFVSVDCFFK